MFFSYTGSKQAICQFNGDGKGNVTGFVTISQQSGAASATFKLNVTGLTPGKHGFIVHANGNLSSDCGGAGGHFNPYNVIREEKIGLKFCNFVFRKLMVVQTQQKDILGTWAMLLPMLLEM